MIDDEKYSEGTVSKPNNTFVNEDISFNLPFDENHPSSKKVYSKMDNTSQISSKVKIIDHSISSPINSPKVNGLVY